MRHLIVVPVALFAQFATADMDSACLNRCTREHHPYEHCQEVCRDNATIASERVPGVSADARVHIGVNGVRSGPQAAACRGYSLSYTDGPSARAESDERLPDLWWHLGETAGDLVKVTLARPVAFTRIAVDWYVYAGSRGAPCENAVKLTSKGRVLAELRPPKQCADPGTMYIATTVVKLPRVERTQEFKLVHSAAPRPSADEDAGSATVRGVTLSSAPDAAGPDVVSATGDVHLPLKGGKERPWAIRETGIFVVPPGGAPIRIRMPGSFDQAIEQGGEVATVRLGETRWYAATAAEPFGNEGPVSQELVVFDTAAPGPSRSVMTFAHPIQDIWFDDCAQTLRVEFDGEPTVRVPVAQLIATAGR